LIVATAAITVTVVSKWNPLPPRDYEDCAARAARDARSKDALGVLLSICSSEFTGRRKAGGGYTYYDKCQDRTFVINGPNPTQDEMKFVGEQCRAYLEREARQEQAAQGARRQEQQAAQEALLVRQTALQARKSAAMNAIHITPVGFKCHSKDDCDFSDLNIEITNGSREAVTGETIGLAFVPTNSACPSSYAERHDLLAQVSPGETRGYPIILIPAAFTKLHLCIKVLDIQFAGE
jgi:hypothetical protein